MRIKSIKLIAYIAFPLFVCTVVYIVFLRPARVWTTTTISDYLVFHNPVIAYLQKKDYFLPDYSAVSGRDSIDYLYAYKEEGWESDQFCIHLTMSNVDMGMVNGYIEKMRQLGSIQIHLKEGQEVWITKETEENMEEKLNSEVHDGMSLFFFFMVLDDNNTVEFWVGKINDAGEIVFPEFTSVFSVIAPRCLMDIESKT